MFKSPCEVINSYISKVMIYSVVEYMVSFILHRKYYIKPNNKNHTKWEILIII